MSTYASLTVSVYNLDESTFEAFIQETFLDGDSLSNAFDSHVISDWEYITDDKSESFGLMMTDSDVKWRPFEVFPALIPLTEKYPEALLKFRIHWSDGDDGDDCTVSYCYVKNGKYFTPQIKVIVEEYDDSKLEPIKGGFYDNGDIL